MFQVLLACLLMVGTAAKADNIERDLDAIVQSYGKVGIFAGTVLVAHDGKTVYEAAVGQANRETNVPNRANTRFNIGSIGKTFTAVSILQLAEAGKLKLSDPISRFLPDIPYAEKDTITVAHLLNHSAGTGNYMAHKDFAANMGKLRTIDAFLPLIYDQPPSFAAGSRFQYSNSGMVLLGAVVEKASGQSYRTYLRDHIFKPAGMTDSSLTLEDEPLSNRSIGYTRNGDGSISSNVRSVPPPSSDGGMRTTTRDMLRYDQALKRTALLSEASKAAMWTPVGPDKEYAFGWWRKSVFGDTVIGHNGGAPGIEAVDQAVEEGSRAVDEIAAAEGVVERRLGLRRPNAGIATEMTKHGLDRAPGLAGGGQQLLHLRLLQRLDAILARQLVDQAPIQCGGCVEQTSGQQHFPGTGHADRVEQPATVIGAVN